METISIYLLLGILIIQTCCFLFRTNFPRVLKNLEKTPTFKPKKTFKYVEKDFPIEMALVQNKSQYINIGIRSILAAASEINKCTNFNFFNVKIKLINEKNYGIHKSILYIMFASYKHRDHSSFDGPGKTLAHASLPPFRTLCIDQSEKWNSKKLYITMLHELCHILGMQHETKQRSIMNPVFKNHKSLYECDKNKLLGLYPFIIKHNKK